MILLALFTLVGPLVWPLDPDLQDLDDIFLGLFDDKGAAAGDDLDDALMFEPEKRLPDGGAADADLLGQRLFADLFARQYLSCDDHVLQDLIGLTPKIGIIDQFLCFCFHDLPERYCILYTEYNDKVGLSRK